MKSKYHFITKAQSIVTGEGHLLQQFDGVWYAYPKRDKGEHTTGGEAIKDDKGRPKGFKSAIQAYRACYPGRTFERKPTPQNEVPVGQEHNARFWRRVKRAPGDACWEWEGSKDGHGYGCFTTEDGRNGRAHRIAYTIANGEIPKGLFVCHRCDNPGCARPDHLFLGTPKDNVQDMLGKGRHKPTGPILNEQAVRDIRRKRQEGASIEELSATYGASHKTLRNVFSGRTWAHVT